MSRWSLRPDPHMAWIYDYHSPRYSSPEAVSLRARRDAALQGCSLEAKREAMFNDEMRDLEKRR